MANGRCDICGRPATVRAQVTSNERRQTMDLCDEHYQQIARQSRSRSTSPLESLFQRRGSLFEDFFGDSPLDDEVLPASATEIKSRPVLQPVGSAGVRRQDLPSG